MLALEDGEFRFNKHTGQWVFIIAVDNTNTTYILQNSPVFHHRNANISWVWNSDNKNVWEIIK